MSAIIPASEPLRLWSVDADGVLREHPVIGWQVSEYVRDGRYEEVIAYPIAAGFDISSTADTYSDDREQVAVLLPGQSPSADAVSTASDRLSERLKGNLA